MKFQNYSSRAELDKTLQVLKNYPQKLLSKCIYIQFLRKKAVLESVNFANRDVISTTLSQTVFRALGGW